jgi:hypothetical protein
MSARVWLGFAGLWLAFAGAGSVLALGYRGDWALASAVAAGVLAFVWLADERAAVVLVLSRAAAWLSRPCAVCAQPMGLPHICAGESARWSG